MLPKTPSLAFVYPETFPQEIIDNDLSEIYADNLDINVSKREVGVFAAFEWIIPTAFVAYIFKGYFDSFLAEAGKDHYAVVKKALMKFLNRGKQSKGGFIVSDGSINKLSITYSQSTTVSFKFQTTDNRFITLLFDDNLNIEDWQNSFDKMLELLSENYSNFPNDVLTLEIENLNINSIYAIINPETKQIEFKDNKGMVDKYK